jgi:hypothetical protein
MRKLGKLPALKKREIPFERRLQNELKKRRVLFVKTKPTVAGFPDRCAAGFGALGLVEIKNEDTDLSERQESMHKKIAAHGVRVLVVHGPDVKAAARKVVAWLRRR